MAASVVHTAEHGQAADRSWLTAHPRLLIIAFGVLLALVLALPGATVITKGGEDLFSLLDGAHHVLWGQMPHRDFHSAIGPLAYLVPALGAIISGGIGTALPVGIAVVIALLAPIAAHILASRLTPSVALGLGAFLLLVLAAPLIMGENATALNFAQFFNRIDWVALSLLLVLYLRPSKREGHLGLDTLCATILVLVLLYTRLSYGVVGLGFLVLMLTDRRQWRWAISALVFVAIAAGLIEFVWGGTATYLADTLRALTLSGIWRGTPGQITDQILANGADYLLFALICALALWRTRSLRDLVFFILCAVIGYWLINGNDQRWGIIILYAAAAIAAEQLLRSMRDTPHGRDGALVNSPGVQLFAIALLLPTIAQCTIALGLHAGFALSGTGRTVNLAGVDTIRLVDLWTPFDFGNNAWYFGTIETGLFDLMALDRAPERVVMLPGPNPFSVLLDLEPARGDAVDLRWNATLNESEHVPAEALFANAEIVVERVTGGGSWEIGALYLPYVREHFDVVSDTADWRIFRRRDAGTGQGAGTTAFASSAQAGG
jgi:hypothetical protein